MSTYADILKAYRDGKPLSSDQRQLLSLNYHVLGREFDDVLEFYLGHYQGFTKKPQHVVNMPFLLPNESLDQKAARELQETVRKALDVKPGYVVSVCLTPWQFIHLRPNFEELIAVHGNQLLTGAPFDSGGVVHVDLFQWGNLYGVVKYHKLVGEQIFDANVLIYFEDKQERDFAEFKMEYFRREEFARQHALSLNMLQPQASPQKPALNPALIPSPVQSPPLQPEPEPVAHIKPAGLTLLPAYWRK